MGKLPPLPTRQTKIRHPSIKGAMGSQPTIGGIAVTKKGPRYRGPDTEKRQNARELMRQLSLACKYLTEKERQSVEWLADGTQLFWRDIAFQFMTGRFMFFVDQSNQRFYSMASQADVSQLLDSIAQGLGMILVRGPNLWEGLEAGAEGYVLTAGAPGALPSWAPSGGGAGTAITTLKVTSDGTANTTWPKNVSFSEAMFDENDAWDPATPDRIYLPPGATAIRLSAHVRITNSTAMRPTITFIDPTDTIRYDLGCYDNARQGTNGFPNNQTTLSGPWVEVPEDLEYIRLRINQDASTNAGYLANTFVCLEAR